MTSFPNLPVTAQSPEGEGNRLVINGNMTYLGFSAEGVEGRHQSRDTPACGRQGHDYFIGGFTTSFGLNPWPLTTCPMAASTPKRAVILIAPFNWPVVHPREI